MHAGVQTGSAALATPKKRQELIQQKQILEITLRLFKNILP
jgi:hypothetical protein